MSKLEIQVKEMVALSAANVLLWGRVNKGTVAMGQRVMVCGGAGDIQARIKGLEVEGEGMATTASAGQVAGLLFSDLPVDGIGLGGEPTAPELNLVIRDLPRNKWWPF